MDTEDDEQEYWDLIDRMVKELTPEEFDELAAQGKAACDRAIKECEEWGILLPKIRRN